MGTVTIAEAWPRYGERFTIEDLDRMPDDGHRYELLDGTLIVSPAPGLPHRHPGHTVGETDVKVNDPMVMLRRLLEEIVDAALHERLGPNRQLPPAGQQPSRSRGPRRADGRPSPQRSRRCRP